MLSWPALEAGWARGRGTQEGAGSDGAGSHRCCYQINIVA